ncbi:MAG: hypothetical protein IPK63_23540 [Candidatus Competibacteraceae bacterium]|nr:hypothetical protein [Candidatus Competibacteraceae bacterium]
MSHAIAITQDTAIMPVSPAAVSLGTLQAGSPAALVQGAREMANALADVIEHQKLAKDIQGRKYVKVEGWTTLGVMLGVVPREVQTTEQDGIYTATIELVRIVDQGVISRASAECGSDDELDRYGKPVWSSRPRYARRSMAQTRATGKACRLAFSWIMSLAGYEPTPAEEMPDKQQSDNDLLISSAQHKMLEARISELGLNREGVKTWCIRRFSIDHFQGLQKSQFSELLNQLPKMAEIKAKREAEQEAQAEREAIQMESQPQPLNNEEKAKNMDVLSHEIREAGRYRSGKVRPREAVEAGILESEARHLRHIAETA